MIIQPKPHIRKLREMAKKRKASFTREIEYGLFRRWTWIGIAHEETRIKVRLPDTPANRRAIYLLLLGIERAIDSDVLGVSGEDLP